MTFKGVDYSIIEKWYGRYLPYNFRDLMRFAITSNELTKSIISTPLILDASAQTAYMKDGFCYLPSLYFTEKFYTDVLDVERKDIILAAVALVNGSQIHEALHHKLLGKKATMQTVLENISFTIDKKEAVHKNIFKDCFNVLEDAFSEHYAEINHASVYPFLDLMSQIFFNERRFAKKLNQFNSRKTAMGVLDILSSYKNTDLLDKNDLFQVEHPDLFEILLRSRNTSLTLQQRFDLSLELYEKLKLMFPEEVDKSSKIDSGDLLDDNNIDNDFKNALIDFIDYKSKQSLEDIEFDFNKILSYDNGEIKPCKIEFLDVMSKRATGSKIAYDRNFVGFSNYLLNARAERQTYGEPRATGSNILINRLAFHSINDGKIFAKQDATRMEKNPPQLIFLIDYSGSMHHSYNGIPKSLVTIVTEVGKTIYRDLRNNNIPCAFYAHTTSERDNYALIIALAAYEMPLMKLNVNANSIDYENRFDCLSNFSTRENADGFALEFVAQRFIDKPGKKVVFVLSDGYPSFGDIDYGGEKAEQHVAKIAENLRNSNISVLSLSLTEDVMKSNNRIYGVKNNIAAYGNLLQSNVMKIIESVSV